MALKINVNVDIDPPKFAARTDRATEALANEVMKDTDKFVPMLTGTLKNSARVQNGDQIYYPGPYAHYQYEGIVYVDPKTGAAGIPTKTGFFSRPGVTKVPSGRALSHSKGQSHWIEPSKAANMDKWLRFYKKELTSGN